MVLVQPVGSGRRTHQALAPIGVLAPQIAFGSLADVTITSVCCWVSVLM